ncbi:MAG: sigma-70 family RNA polymerase sigma factor [Pseudomonadota bacterium]
MNESFDPDARSDEDLLAADDHSDHLSSPVANPHDGRLDKLYRDFSADLTSALRSTYGTGPPDPDEVVQKAFAKLSGHRALNRIKDLKSYIWITARNLMLTDLRAQSTRSRHAQQHLLLGSGNECDDFDPERVLIAREQLGIVMDTIKGLPERRRKIFLAKRVDGLSAEAAGRKYGVTRTAAVRHIAIATEEIDKALSRHRSLPNRTRRDGYE